MIAGAVRQFNFTNYNSLGEFLSGYSTVGITYDEKDPFFTNNSTKKYKMFTFVITTGEQNSITATSTISIGKTDMYEITQPMPIRSITFPNGVPQSIQINVCGYSKEEE